MTRTLRPPAALAMVAMVAAISAGCGGTGSSGGTSTAAAPAGTGSSKSTAASHNSTATAREKAVKFAQCMRDNGVSEFPDPAASGDFTIEQIANGSSVDTNGAAFTQALSACKNLEPPGFTGYRRSPEQQRAALVFAQCIRDHGVQDFPDPARDAPLVDTNRIPSSATESGLAILNAAMRKCPAEAAGVRVP